MKNIFVILAVLSCIFVSAVEAAPQKYRVSKKRAVNEREILINNCHEIRANIAHQFAGMGAGALQSSAYRNTVKRGITDYLNSVGTPTAHQLLSEIQANDFRDFL
jgi:hypothetical protein